ncbi:MAG: hypothetical protein ACTSPY_00065 [Candidatus Helarchaeota archaeon]
MDLTKLFSLRNAFFLSIASSILAISSWISLISWNSILFMRLVQAGVYYSNLNQIGGVVWLYSIIWLQISFGGVLSFISLFISFILLKETKIILFNREIKLFEIGIIIIIINILNLFAASGYIIGSILGLCSGTFILVKKYFEYINYEGFKEKEKDYFIEIDLT